MENPLNYVTLKDIKELGITEEELLTSYQPSSGGVYHARGAESKGKTLWGAHYWRYLVDNGIYVPEDGVGNLTFKGKYGAGFQVLKGDKLREYLWDLTHKPYRDKFVFIDEIDSEFPARSFTDREQTEISLRLWHTAKLGNTVIMTSHIGNSTDLIIHLASHYYIYPDKPDFTTNTMDFTIANALDITIDDWTAHDIIKSMLIYNRTELTEDTEEEQAKVRPVGKKITKEAKEDIDEEAELLALGLA